VARLRAPAARALARSLAGAAAARARRREAQADARDAARLQEQLYKTAGRRRHALCVPLPPAARAAVRAAAGAAGAAMPAEEASEASQGEKPGRPGPAAGPRDAAAGADRWEAAPGSWMAQGGTTPRAAARVAELPGPERAAALAALRALCRREPILAALDPGLAAQVPRDGPALL
jgi:hypothetical protein